MWGNGDVDSEGGELGEESAGLALFAEAVGEVIGAEALVGDEVVEDVPGGDQDGVANGDGGAFAASVRDQTSVLAAQLSALTDLPRAAHATQTALRTALGTADAADLITPLTHMRPTSAPTTPTSPPAWTTSPTTPTSSGTPATAAAPDPVQQPCAQRRRRAARDLPSAAPADEHGPRAVSPGLTDCHVGCGS